VGASVSLNFSVATPYRIGGSTVAAIHGRLRTDGRFFVDDQGTARPLFASFLSRWMEPGRDAVLDEIAERFNGCRIFSGDLGWAGQTPASARAALPGLLTAAAERDLQVYVCACTGGGYDVRAHLREVGHICATFTNATLEGFNEVGHPTQSDIGRDPARALEACRSEIPAGVTWTVGAPVGTDEPTPDGTYPTDGGLFNDAHLDRGRDTWNQVRRVREIAAISSSTGKPAMSGEPIGAAEQAIAGKRRNDPEFFYTFGLLSRGFEVGTVFHSEAGLQGQRLGPVQRTCADAFVAGFHAIPTDARLSFVNAGWPGSPVAGANFENGIVRAYSFISQDKGWTVLVGRTGDARVMWGGGWRFAGLVDERPGVQLLAIER
jgi:hypothetical protein